jgi:RNA polymerase sigma-70 factor (ECF subfamily)
VSVGSIVVSYGEVASPPSVYPHPRAVAGKRGRGSRHPLTLFTFLPRFVSIEPPSIPTSTIDADALAVDSLVEQARDGDVNAFSRLVDAFHPRVHRWALAYAADADEADDVAQEVFVLALRRLAQYRGGGVFPVWLYRITCRAAGQLQRTRARRARLAAGVRAEPERRVYETDPGGRVDREQLAALVRGFWHELPERQRAILDLVDLQGQSPATVAEMLELNPATVRANLFKARQSIRRRVLQRVQGRLLLDEGYSV